MVLEDELDKLGLPRPPAHQPVKWPRPPRQPMQSTPVAKPGEF